MSTASMPLAQPDRGVASKILLAGILVGLLDGFSAWFYWVVLLGKSSILRIFQAVAAAVLGKDSFSGGVPTFLLGLAMHFCVAFGWTIVYYLLWKNWPALQRRVRSTGGAVLVGALYGIFVHLMMQFVVLRFTKVTPGPVTATWFWVGVLIHMLAVGQPIALTVRTRSPAQP